MTAADDPMSDRGNGKAKGNGRADNRRSGYDRRVGVDPAYRGPERRSNRPRRTSDRAPDKPVRR